MNVHFICRIVRTIYHWMFLYILIHVYDVPLFQDAAKYLQKEADKWEDENNPIVQVAKEMSSQMEQMAEYCQGEGPVGVSFI